MDQGRQTESAFDHGKKKRGTRPRSAAGATKVESVRGPPSPPPPPPPMRPASPATTLDLDALDGVLSHLADVRDRLRLASTCTRLRCTLAPHFPADAAFARVVERTSVGAGPPDAGAVAGRVRAERRAARWITTARPAVEPALRSERRRSPTLEHVYAGGRRVHARARAAERGRRRRRRVEYAQPVLTDPEVGPGGRPRPAGRRGGRVDAARRRAPAGVSYVGASRCAGRAADARAARRGDGGRGPHGQPARPLRVHGRRDGRLVALRPPRARVARADPPQRGPAAALRGPSDRHRRDAPAAAGYSSSHEGQSSRKR